MCRYLERNFKVLLSGTNFRYGNKYLAIVHNVFLPISIKKNTNRIIIALFKKEVSFKTENPSREIEILMDHYKVLKERNYNLDYLELDYEIFLSDYQPYIEYKIGYKDKHKYVLRDTQAFILALRNETKLEFGKNLT